MADNNKLATTEQSTGLLQMAKIGDIKKWYNEFVKLSKDVLKDGLDFGVIPGVAKPALFKPGAEKLRFVYRLQTETTLADKEIDLDNNLLDFTYRTIVKSPDGTQVISTCEGNANSWETKFRYVWVKEDQLPDGTDTAKLLTRKSSISEFQFAIEKAETTGQYGKPAEYWMKWNEAIKSGAAVRIKRKVKSGKEMDAWEMASVVYRIENPDVMGLKNTIMKMAQKRSFVGAMLIATGASEFFTQDVEDMEIPVDEDPLTAAAKTQGPAKVAPAPAKPAPKNPPKAANPTYAPPEPPAPVMEGEVVDEPAAKPAAKPAEKPLSGGDPIQERMKIAKLKWVNALVTQGKIPAGDYDNMNLEQLDKVMADYKAKLGK